MEFLVEILLEFLFEFVVQVVLQALVQGGLHALAEPFRRPPNAWVAALGYVLLGTALGALSVWLFPNHLVHSDKLRWANLAVTPWAVGASMAFLGMLRARRGKLLLRADHFSWGYLFALSVALVRFVWAT